MTRQLKHQGTRGSVFELIKMGLPIHRDIGLNPFLWHHFVGSRQLRRSVDFRPTNAKGYKGRKNVLGNAMVVMMV